MGIQAGKKAGMFTVGVTNTFSKAILQEASPDLIISNVMKLID